MICDLCMESDAAETEPVRLRIDARVITRSACVACRTAKLIRPDTLWQIKRWAARSGIHEPIAKRRRKTPFNVNPLDYD